MQRHSSTTQVTRVCASLLTPGLPIALFVKTAIDTAVHAHRQRGAHADEHDSRPSLRYWTSAVLGVQALPSNDDRNESNSVSLLSTKSALRRFERSPVPYDWRLLGRIIVLFAFTAQAVIALCQWIRRISFSYQNSFVSEGDRQTYGMYCDMTSYGFTNVADMPIDHLNALAVLGGLTASLSSVCLTVMNSNWKYHDTVVGHELSGGDDESVTSVDYTIPLSPLMRFGFCFDVLVLSRMITHYLLPRSVLRFDIWYQYKDPAMMSIIVLFGLGWLCLLIIPLRGLWWAVAPLRPRSLTSSTARFLCWFRAFRCSALCSGMSWSLVRAPLRKIPWPEHRPLPSWPDELGLMGLIIAAWRAVTIYVAFVTLYQLMGHEILKFGPVENQVSMGRDKLPLRPDGMSCIGFDCCYPFFLWKDPTFDKLWTF